MHRAAAKSSGTRTAEGDPAMHMAAVSDCDMLDIVGIGFGPSGIALAAAIDDAREKARNTDAVRVKFYERRTGSAWHPDFMLDGSDINNHFLRDLATPRDPRSRFTFANYLKAKNRLYDFGRLGRPPSRQEWSDYIEWVACQLSRYVSYDDAVEDVRPLMPRGILTGFAVETARSRSLAKNLVVSVGAEAFIPEPFRAHVGARVFHTSQFISRIATLPGTTSRFIVVGGGQSAGEAIFDLRKRFPNAEIVGIQRSSGFKLYDLGHFSNRVYNPDETDYFYDLPPRHKPAALAETLRTNYSGLDFEISAALYQQMYEDRVAGSSRIDLRTRCRIDAIGVAGDRITMRVTDAFSGRGEAIAADAVVLATGFSVRPIPPVIENMRSLMRLDAEDKPLVNRDYSVEFATRRKAGLYLSGLCEHSHGIGEGQSFSLLALRGETILKSVLDRNADEGASSLQNLNHAPAAS
jgi:L-ornithine N5-monooxygenase